MKWFLVVIILMLNGKDEVIDYRYDDQSSCAFAREKFIDSLSIVADEWPDEFKSVAVECIDEKERGERMRAYQQRRQTK